MTDRLKNLVLYTYGIPDLFFGLMIAMEVYFFPIFLTDYALFPLTVVTPILLITGIADIFCTFGGGILLQSVFILVISIASLGGALSASWIGVKLGKRRSYWVFLALAALGFASARFLPESPWTITIACGAATFFGMLAGAMNTALFSDTVVYGEWKAGRSIRAFIMSACNAPIKVGVFIRSATLGIGLIAIGFVANTDPAREAVDGIRFIMTCTPAAACALAAVIFYFGYRLEDADILNMQEELASRGSAPR